jgi:hypothetical protein
MESSNLLIVCALAFGAVFVLLLFLAIVMRVILAVFPQRAGASDAAVFAAVAAASTQLYPGTIIKKIEEIK